MASARDEARRRAEESKARVLKRIADQQAGFSVSQKSEYDYIRNRPIESAASNSRPLVFDEEVHNTRPNLFDPRKQLSAAQDFVSGKQQPSPIVKKVAPKTGLPSFQEQIQNINTLAPDRPDRAAERQQRAKDSLLTDITRAGQRIINKVGGVAAEPLQKLFPAPESGTIASSIKERGPLIEQIGRAAERAAIPGITDNSAVPNFIRGVGDTATFGLSTYVDRMAGLGERADGATQTTAGKAGQIAGGIILPAGKVRAGAGLVRNLGEAAFAGGIIAGLGEVGEAATNRNDQTTGQRLTDAALGAGLGVAGGLLGHAVSKGVQKLLAKYNVPQKTAEKILGLPAPKERGNVNAAATDDVITPEYTFKLPEASEGTLGKVKNAAEARKDLKEIDDDIRQTKAAYDRAVTEEYKYLKESMGKGVTQGGIIKNTAGEVTGRYGRQSNNPQWYRDFYKANGRKPNNKELYAMAKDRIDNGFKDEQGEVPSWRAETRYDDQVAALEEVRATIAKSIRELDPAIHITDSALVSKELAFGKGAKSAASQLAKAAEPAPKATLAKRKPLKTTVKSEEPKAATASEAPKSPPKASAKTDEQPKAEQSKTSEKPKSGSETKKQENVRANFGTQKESSKFSEETNRRINEEDHTYEPKTNKETVDNVNKTMKDVDKAEDDFLSNRHIREGNNAEHTALGYRLMQEFDAKGQYDKAIQISKKLAADLTKQGQGVQAANIIHRLSPEGQLMSLTRKAEANGMDVLPEDRKAFKEAAELAKESANPALRSNAVQDVLDKLEEGQEPSESDLMLLRDALKRAKKLGIETNAAMPKPKPKLETKVKAEKPKASEKTIPEAEKPAPTKREKALAYMQKQEDEAWKRIQQRRGLGFVPKGGNEIVDYAIIAANRVARGVIKTSNHVEQLVKMFGEEVRPYASKIFKEAQKHVRDNPDLDDAKKTVKSAEELVEQFAKRTSTSHADLKKLRDLAKQVEKLEGKQGRNADIAMQEIMNKYEKSSITDKVQALRYMMMLGNTATQGINITSNIAMAVLKNTVDVGGAMLESILKPVLRNEKTTAAFGNNPLRFMADFIQNYGIGAKANWKGVNPSGLHSLDEIQGLAFRSKLNPLHYGEKTLKAVAGGADYAIYKTQFDNELKKQAKLAASRTKPDDRAKFIRDFMAQPSDDAIEIADKVARETTFQQQGGLGDVAAKGVASLGHKGKIGKALEQGVRAIAPFIRTPLNIATTGVNMTPFGLLNGTYKLIKARTPAAQREAISRLGLGLTGSGMGALGYYLNQIGVITEGNDSGDRDLDALREQTGNGAYRFNQSGLMRYLHAMFNGEGWEVAEASAKYQEGDRTFDYNRLQPIAFPLAVGAGLEEGSDEGVTHGLISAGGQALGTLASMSALKGIQDAFNVQQKAGATAGDKQLSWANRILESYVKSFSPSLLAQQARVEDTTQRQTPYNKGLVKDVKGYYKSRIPSLGGLIPEEYTSKSLPAKKTTLGQDKKYPAGVGAQYFNPYRSEVQSYSEAAKIISDLVELTGDTTIVPKAPLKTISGKDKATKEHVSKAIDPQRYAQYQADIGNEITRKILEMSPDLSDDAKVKKVKKIYDDVTEKYRTRLKREMGISIK